jgi:MscS family membrane protein
MLETIKAFLAKLNIMPYLESLTIEQVLYFSVGVVLIILPLMLRKPIARFLSRRVEYFLNKAKLDAPSTNATLEGLAKPLELLGYLISISILINYFDFNKDTSTFVVNIQHSLGIIIVFWVLYACIHLLGRSLKKLQKVLTKEMVDWLLRTIRILIIFLAIAAVLELWGIKVAPILAGLGLFGVAVALGAQDLFKNIIAGVLVLAEKRFEEGDWIKIDGVVEGTVAYIGFRSTKVVRFDKAPVYVPNTKLSENAVTNFTKMSHRQVKFQIGVLYSTTTQQLKQICDEINNYIVKNNDFAKEDVTTFVKVTNFGASSIDIQIYAFTHTTVWTEWLLIQEDLRCEIKKIVENAGTEFAFPSTSLYIEEDKTKQA